MADINIEFFTSYRLAFNLGIYTLSDSIETY